MIYILQLFCLLTVTLYVFCSLPTWIAGAVSGRGYSSSWTCWLAATATFVLYVVGTPTFGGWV